MLMRAARRAVALVVLTFMLSACSVAEADLVGTWETSSITVEDIPESYSKPPSRLVLAGDGTFIASDLVLPKVDSSGFHRVTGSGTWKLTRAGSQVIRINFEQQEDARPATRVSEMQLVVLPGLRDNRLAWWVGDPDLAEGMYFSKVGN